MENKFEELENQNDSSSLKIMESWLNFIQNLSNKNLEDVEMIFGNILEVLKELASKQVFSKEEFQNESEKFFFSTFVKELINSILKDNTKNPIIKAMQTEVIEILLKEFVNNIGNPKLNHLIEAANNIFNEDSIFYRSTDGKDASEIFLEKIYSVMNPNSYEWRSALKEGSMIDYLHREVANNENSIYKSIGVASWTRAEIISIDENKIANIRLVGTGALISNVSLISSFVLPSGVLSKDFEWRLSLEVGDEIDYLDNRSWYRSTVLNTYNKFCPGVNAPDKFIKMINLGLRVYRDNGRTMDGNNCKKYFGWPPQFDKETSVYDAKLRQPNLFSKAIDNYHLITTYPIDSKKFNELDTFVPFEINDRKLFIIPKKYDVKNIDYNYYYLINQFCEKENGLYRILDFFRNSLTTTINYELFCNFVDIISNIHIFMHLQFAKKYMKEFVNISLSILKKFSQEEVRNFKRDKLECVIKKLKDMLFKICIDVDVNILFDLFGVEFGLNCFKCSNILDKKLLGLKILTETLTEATKWNNSPINSDKHLTAPFLMAKLFQNDDHGNNILDLLYASQSHSQILQKSSDLLKTFFMGRVLTTVDMQRLLTISDRASDADTKNAIYKGIQQNCTHLGLELQVFLIKYMMEIPADKISEWELDIICSIFKSLPVYGNKELIPSIAEYFFNLICYQSHLLSVKLYENAAYEWINLIKTIEFREIVLSYISKLVNLIKTEKSEFIKLIKILRKLLQSLVTILDDSKLEQVILILFTDAFKKEDSKEVDSSEEYSKKNSDGKNFNIINFSLDYLLEYHKQAKIIIESKHKCNEYISDIDNYIFQTDLGRKNYSTHSDILNEIISFLGMFNNLKNFTFLNEQISLLYQICVQDYLSIKDLNLFFKWLKEAEDKKVIPNGTFEIIFGMMMDNKELEFSNITLELFNCLWNIFITINKNAGKILVSEYSGESTYAYSGVSNTGQTLLSYSYNPEKKNNNEIKCLIDNPSSLIGFDLIWKLIISSSATSELSKKSIQNILKLFLINNVTPEERGKIWDKLMDKCIVTIKQIKNQNFSNKFDLQDKKMKIINCLNILKSLIEETEKKGTAGCISHSSILKNSIINLKIVNFISAKGGNKDNNANDKNKSNLNLRVYLNTTIWDLKKLISEKIGVIPESIKFNSVGNKDITDNDHGKTLNDLKLKDNDSLTILKNPILDQIPKITLIKDGQLIDKAVKAFSEIFDQFSTNGYMNPEQCAQFAMIAIDTNENISPDDNRIKVVFDQHDKDRDGLITLEGFCGFFHYAIVVQKKPNTVWDNLKSFNYRNDLKKLNEPLDEYNTIKEIMPRFVLSNKIEYFNIIFDLQYEEDLIAKEATKLLSNLCTNPFLYRDILLLKDTCDWNRYLVNTDYFKLLYSLQIIDSLFEIFEMANMNADNENLENSTFDVSDKELLTPTYKLIWMENFLTKGGLTHLISNVFLNTDLKINPQYKKCLNLSLKIIRICSVVLFSARNRKNKKEEVISLIRKESLSENGISPEDSKAIEGIFNEVDTTQAQSNKIDTKSEEKNKLEESLVQIINNNYGDSIIEKINFEALAQKIIKIAYEFILKNDSDFEERSLVNNSINYLSIIIVSQNDVVYFLNKSIYPYSFIINDQLVSFENFINSGLLLGNILSRINLYKTLKNVAQSLSQMKENSFTFKLLDTCNQKITNLTKLEKTQCKYFFELYLSLIETVIINFEKDQSTEFKNKINFESLAVNMVEVLKNECNTIEEELLNGYLKILNIILLNKGEELKVYIGVKLNLITILVENYLIKDFKFDSETLFDNNFNKSDSEKSSLIDPSDLKYKSAINIPNYTSYDSRNNIFNLILNLTCGRLENIETLFGISKLNELTKYTSLNNKDKKFYNPITEKRSSHGYSGLKNLRCICYMNSVLQQFFNIPTFRYAIMQCNDRRLPNYTDVNKTIDDNPLHQLQKMFVHLEMTYRCEYNPAEFCYAFKGIDNQPTNINIQQDAQEFLGRLFDILENSLKETEYKYLFQSVFLGKNCSQLVCKGGCGKVRNTFEDFYNLSLEVQGIKSLKESLQKYCSEDRIDDFFCENCQKKVTVVKRNSFAELPNVIIMHLKRIQFNYETFVNEKINSRLEFPKQINMKDFCSETLANQEGSQEVENDLGDRVFDKEDSYYEYELVGVVIHLGVAEAGHYYSYINVKREGTFDKMNYDPNNENDVKKWLTFNDSNISSFSTRNLEEDCFGGTSGSGNSDSLGATKDEDIAFSLWGPSKKHNSDRDNSKNAYMLVYERIKKNPLKMIIKNLDDTSNPYIKNKSIIQFNEENRSKIVREFCIFSNSNSASLDCENTAISRRDNPFKIYNNIFLNENTKEYTYYIPFYNLDKLIPSNYFYDVVQDNIRFINDQKIYSNTFSEFNEKLILNLVKYIKSNQETLYDPKFIEKIFETLLNYLIEIISSSYFRDNLKAIVENLNDLIKLFPELSNLLIEYIYNSKERLIFELLFSSEEISNISYKNLIVNAILQEFKLNSTSISLAIEMYEEYEKTNNIPCVIKLLDYLLSMMPIETSKLWTKIFAYLDLIDDLARSNDEVLIQYLFKNELIFKLIDFMLGKDSPHYKGGARTEMGNRYSIPKFTPLVSAVSLLVRRCYTMRWTENDHQIGNVPHTFLKCGDRVFTMTKKEMDCLLDKNFYKKSIKEGYGITPLARLIAHLMFNDYRYSKKKTFLILDAINEIIPSNESKVAFDLIYHPLLIDDEFTNYRLEWIYGLPQMNIRTSDINSPYLLQRDNKWSERIIKYIGPLNYGTNFDCLIERIITRYQSNVDFINILNCFFAVMFSRKHIFNYINSMPHPRNDNLYLKDYLIDLAIGEKERISGVPQFLGKYDKAIKGITTIIEEYDKKANEINADSENEETMKKFSPKYKYGSIIRENVTNIPIENLNFENAYLLMVDYDVEIDGNGLDLEGFDIDNNKNDLENKNIPTEVIASNSNIELKIESTPKKSKENFYEPGSSINNLNELETDEDGLNNSNMANQGDDETKNPNFELADEDFTNNERKEDDREMEVIHLKTDNNLNQLIKKSNSDEKIDLNKGKNISTNEKADANSNNINSNLQINNNEETYIMNNLSDILQKQIITRTFYNRFSKDSKKIIENSIKRYVIYNIGEKELKVRIDFKYNDEFVNTYIPYSEIVVYAKKNKVTTIYVFLKDDIRLPWNEIDIDVTCEICNIENQEQANNQKIQNKSIKKSHSDGNLNNDAPGPIDGMEDSTKIAAETPEVPKIETFPIVCDHCNHVNEINTNAPNYNCSRCQKEVWG